MSSTAYYAVKTGRNPGIYSTWDECQKQISQFKGAKYKKFSTAAQAQSFIDGELDIIPVPLAPKLNIQPFNKIGRAHV